ncbi:MAG: toll/interleukin-1 receptor domain-containing protein [Sphingobium sp.]
MTQEGGDAEAVYAAFLSYNHKDVRAARQLHRRLESYRLPKGATRPDGSRRLGPIFRDRDELPAAADLSEAVKQALSQSHALVVLCSPNSAASPWVDKEIRLFRAIHPDRPILAAIIDGEPEDALPAALSEGPEPLAADLRPQGDGRRLGTLKLVAGLAGTGLDRLVQRDAQRRIRRVTAITVASLVVMLGFFALAVMAMQAQREAERQRSEAEGMVEFMLTDLRERLRSVGRLDALSVVNERAMNYYKDQGDLDRLPNDSLERRARILQAMGEDDIARGNLPAAMRKFEEAHRTTSALLDDDPAKPEWIFAHAQSEFWIGQVDQLSGRADAALRRYQAYLRRALELLRLQPGEARSFMEVGYALSNIASVEWESLNDHDRAIRNYTRSLRWFERAQTAAPRSLPIRMEVAERHARIADVQFDRKDYPSAREHRLEQLKLLEPLRREDPENGDIAYDTLVAIRSLARIAFETGDLADAARLLDDAKERSWALSKRDPENQSWFEQNLRILIDAAEVARARGRGSEVRRLVDQARLFMRESNPRLAAVPKFRATSIQRLDAIAQVDGSNMMEGK